MKNKNESRYEHDRVSVAAASALRNLAMDPRNCTMLGEYAMEDLVNKLPLPGEAPMSPGPAAIYALSGVLLQLVQNDQQNAARLVPYLLKTYWFIIFFRSFALM